jgi:hypothetical protein
MQKIELENKDKVIRFVKQDGVWELLLDDDRHYVWIEPNTYSDANKSKMNKVYVDKDMVLEVVFTVVLSCCLNCKKDDIKFF